MQVYLDNSATTKPVRQAVEACVFAMEHEYGNPSSLHKMGFEAEKLLLDAKARISAMLSCQKEEILFLSGATEANNLAIFGTAKALQRKGKRIITTAIEHPSVLEPMNELLKQGFDVVFLSPNKDGVYTKEMFADAVDDNTILVSTMWVNNENGMVLPIEEIGDEIKRKNPNVIYHVDGVQGFLKLPIKLKTAKIDLFSVSGHKVCAPKGIGALYVKSKTRLERIIYGGGQQGGIRSGTEAVPLISAFGAAVLAQSDSYLKKAEEHQTLKEYVKDALSGNEGVGFFEDSFTAAKFAPHILSISVKGIPAEVLLHFLESKEIFVSSGSACAKGKKSHVLSEFAKLDKRVAEQLNSTIRVSFGQDTTVAELDRLKEGLLEGISAIKKSR